MSFHIQIPIPTFAYAIVSKRLFYATNTQSFSPSVVAITQRQETALRVPSARNRAYFATSNGSLPLQVGKGARSSSRRFHLHC